MQKPEYVCDICGAPATAATTGVVKSCDCVGTVVWANASAVLVAISEIG